MRGGENEIHALQVAIREEDVLHFLGYPPGMKPQERTGRRLQEIREEAVSLAEARGIYMHLTVERAPEVGLEAVDGTGLVLGLVTAGGALETRAERYIRDGDATSALMLEAAGSAAAEEAADRLGAVIAGCGDGGEGVAVSCRISPGYGTWKLEDQRKMFDLLPHGKVGVDLLPSMLMIPRKSISFAMWLGAEGSPSRGLSGCAVCKLETCRYRRITS
jgi:hypothetical protein